MSHFLNQNLHQVLWTPLALWLGDHPLMHWFLTHPFVLLGVSLVVLLLLAGLMSAIAHLTQNLWLRLLQLPIHLVQSLGQVIATGLRWLFKRLFARSSSTPSKVQSSSRQSPIALSSTDPERVLLEENSQHHELKCLLNRLDNIRQEEDALIEKIKALVEEQAS